MPSPAPSSMASNDGLQSPNRLVLDNLIRRELKVGDPNDPTQVAQALLERYRGDPRAQAIAQEARGLPFLQAAAVAAPLQSQSAASGSEWQQAVDDIERDLGSLTQDAILKDVTPELRGWGQAIRTALQEGYNAARFALDPRNRDKGFAMRRQLNDYARLARLVGAHTPAMVTSFRKFGQSLDEASNLMLVIMGEALSNVGFGGGRYLPQVAYSDLQVRRDAVIYALRNLVGSTQQAYGPEEWPRGLDAYRQLNSLLEAQGQNDLRSLLVETELARTMDDLVQRSGDTSAEGLRGVGSTALLALERFRRFVAVGRRGVSPESPALYAFLEALQLFASAFDTAGGFRLMKIARPPILFYGLYGNTGLDDADGRLISMITQRGLLADAIDCMADACCSGNRACLVLLDKVLYDTDRAIDLYALGSANFGTAERRASAYGFVIDAVLGAQGACRQPGGGARPIEAPLAERLQQLADRDLRPFISASDDAGMKRAVASLSSQINQALAGLQLLQQADDDDLAAVKQALPNTTHLTVTALARHYVALRRSQARLAALKHDLPDDPALEAYLDVVEEELCLQRDMEVRWSGLVQAMVPNCGGLEASLAAVRNIVEAAVAAAVGTDCVERAPIDLPPTLETSFDTLIDGVERTGLGRPNRVLLRHQR